MSKSAENKQRRQIAEQFKTRIETMLGRTIDDTEEWIPVLSKTSHHTEQPALRWSKFRDDDLYLQWHQLEPHRPRILVLSGLRHAHSGLDINAEDLWEAEGTDEDMLEGDKERLVFAIKRRDKPTSQNPQPSDTHERSGSRVNHRTRQAQPKKESRLTMPELITLEFTFLDDRPLTAPERNELTINIREALERQRNNVGLSPNGLLLAHYTLWAEDKTTDRTHPSFHERRPATTAELGWARGDYASSDINIDDDALVSEAGDGHVWVQGWLRVEINPSDTSA